ncbi:MAG: hypothetical protein AB9882_11895 [Ignavibacteriaceae bacterium]
MKTYKINKIPYSLRDFTLGEKNKVALIKAEIARDLIPEENKDITIDVSLSDERLCEILNFILETENEEAANITPADLQNTGTQTFSGLLIDFLANEIQYALEKKDISRTR